MDPKLASIPEGATVPDGMGGQLVWLNGQWRRVKSPEVTPPLPKADGSIVEMAPLMRGEFHLEVHDILPDGRAVLNEEESFSDYNLIVANAPLIMALNLGGIDSANNRIGGVQWGDGPDATTPPPPAATDTALENLILTTTTVFPPTTGTTFVQFTSVMGTGVGNGNVFTEAGLVTVGNGPRMFARKTFPGITKDSNKTLTVRWVISFLQNASGCDCQGIGLFGELGPINRFKFVAVGAETAIAVPLIWTAGLNRLWVWRNGKRIFSGDAYTENHPVGITGLSPAAVAGEVFYFEVLE